MSSPASTHTPPPLHPPPPAHRAQEDSNWPLTEGSALKKRFDDIFDSARYTRALASIKEVRKRKADDLKEAKAAAEAVGTAVRVVESTRAQIEGKSRKITELTAGRAALEGKMEVARGVIADLEAQEEGNREDLRKVERLRADRDAARKAQADAEAELAGLRGVDRDQADRLRSLAPSEVALEEGEAVSAVHRMAEEAGARADRLRIVRARLATVEGDLASAAKSSVAVAAARQQVEVRA
jgi:DNA repair protein RAD50